VRENAQRIFGLVQAVVDSIANIVAGNIGGAANFIEQSLAKLVPIAISLFANLLGVGGIADKMKDIITKIQTKVDQAIDKLIDRVLKKFKGKDKDKDGKDKTGDGTDKDGKGKDKDKDKDKKPGQVGARITFNAHGETHTQYIDASGLPMVASTPATVKSRIAEWRPRLRELPDADQKKAGQLIGKAIAIEKNVAQLATKAKSGDTAAEGALEAKQRQLADQLAGLFELMAPDHDPSKPLTELDPKDTLKSPQYQAFKSRFMKTASELDMPGGAGAAQELWLKVVTTLAKTDAAYKAAPNDAKTGRKDLSTDAFQKIMKEFDPITAALAPYVDKWGKGKKSWAFWSGKPAVVVAQKHADVCLEKTPLGALFDGLNINGSWDIQMWGPLSKAYATHAAAHIGQTEYRGFVGMGSSSEQSIFNKIEQPQFVSMLSEKQRASLHIDWYAAAGDPKSEMKQPDWRFHAGSLDGLYGKGDRASMVALAESENKRRLELWKEHKIDEGPGGAGTAKDPLTNPVSVAVTMNGAAHTLVAKPGGTPSVDLHSRPGGVQSKAGTATQNLRKQSSPEADARVAELGRISQQASQLETTLKTPGATTAAVESALKGLAGQISSYGSTHKASDLDEVSDVAEVPKALLIQERAVLTHPSEQLKKDAADTQSGAVLYTAANADPKQVTKTLLANHADAKLDNASGTLMLSPVRAPALESASSVRGLAASVVQMTGISNVSFVRDESGWYLDGSINPKIERLASYKTDGGPLDDRKRSRGQQIGKKSTTREVLLGICRERAKAFGATVEFIDERRPPPSGGQHVLITKAHFAKGTDVWDVDIVTKSDDTKCPCCGRAITHSAGTPAPVGVANPLGGLGPHTIIPRSVWEDVFDGVMSNTKYSLNTVTLPPGDSTLGAIRAAATSTSVGPGTDTQGRRRSNLGGVSVDRQCQECDNYQDRPLTGGAFQNMPATLLERGEAEAAGVTMAPAASPTGGGVRDYKGNQFSGLTPEQMIEVTHQKIEDVCDRIRLLVRRLKATHAVRAVLTDTLLEDFLNDVTASARTRAEAGIRSGQISPGDFPS
jgi:hypothetical protein